MKYRELDKHDKNLFAKDFLKTFLCEVGRWLLAFGSAGLIFVLLILAFRWKYGFIIIVSLLVCAYGGVSAWGHAVSNQKERDTWRTHLTDREARIKEMRRQLELIDAEPNEQIDAGCLKYLTMDGEQKLEERKYYKNKISQYEKEAELARIKLEGLGEKIS